MMQWLITIYLALLTQIAAQEASPQDFADRERELTNLLQQRLRVYEAQRSVGNVRFSLGSGPADQQADAKPTTTAQDLNVPATFDAITQTFWTDAKKILNSAGMSTPIPQAAFVNAPPKTAAPGPWEEVEAEAKQPLDVKLGSAVMAGLTPAVTPTPPPSQGAIGQQFVAQCPMVLFESELSIRAPSCNDTLGRWIDLNPLNPRVVLRWHHVPPAGLFFGVDSKLTGPGSAMFADITQSMTLTGYKFVIKNCLGIERWHVEENVYKVDSMGKVSSSLELHDVTMNAEAFFIKYLVKSADGVLVAESSLFRMLTNQFNFTEVKDGQNTGKVLAMVTRQGVWTKKGWEQCMAPTSPRGWTVQFSSHVLQASTVQDIRVAIAGAVNLMAYRNQDRGSDGLNTQGSTSETYTLVGGLTLLVFGLILCANFLMVWRGSGLQKKLKKILFDAQGMMPAKPYQERAAPLHPSY